MWRESEDEEIDRIDKNIRLSRLGREVSEKRQRGRIEKAGGRKKKKMNEEKSSCQRDKNRGNNSASLEGARGKHEKAYKKKLRRKRQI